MGIGWYLLAPALAAFGAYGGTVWTVRSWASCPLGNDASGNVGLLMTLTVVWLCMTLLLLLIQLAMRRWPIRGGRAAVWLAPLAAAAALTLLYRLGMDWPHHPPGGECMEGYPLFPFTGKPGPHSAE
ncbi:hypothetical protein H4W23_02150 [Streptomyces gardneri]|uniref:hypothetical protein n=1 Tax=Streptomyces gardneri TaxID=66892 RepID=UPI00126615A6|nr:hypothetical protein [Streptomyces gardneri]QPK43543.1 hypothetical protein H4W23_02150 [Streptomyces gardneri]WRK34780.1 hypothetical protein U0M97_02160 [Streptomyces venezuelae]